MKTNKKNIQDNKMRFLITISLASLLLFFGCDNGSDLTSPFSESYNQQQKIASDFTLSENGHTRNPYLDRPKEYPPGSDSVFVAFKLPASEIPNLVKSQVIDGDKGGIIDFNYQYTTRKGNTINISAALDFPSGAFDGEKEISMVFNNENATISFYPHMVFNKPVELVTLYTGLDLSGHNPDSVDFIFQNFDGTTENLDYEYVIMNISTGTIAAEDVQLPHFSRYGFVN